MSRWAEGPGPFPSHAVVQEGQELGLAAAAALAHGAQLVQASWSVRGPGG